MPFRIQFTVSASMFAIQKKKMKESKQKKVITYLRTLNKTIVDINNKKRKIIHMLAGIPKNKEAHYLPLKLKCVKKKMRYHKSLPVKKTDRLTQEQLLERIRDPQVTVLYEFQPFIEEENMVKEFVKTYNKDDDSLITIDKNSDKMQLMYMSKITRFIFNIQQSIQVDWDIYAKMHKLDGIKMSLTNITYVQCD
jgi:hypothetical protein